MKIPRIYDTNNPSDMEELEQRYSKDHINKIRAKLDHLVKNKEDKKKHEFKSGYCCPNCGSINYFQSGTCKTCHDCSFAGGCG